MIRKSGILKTALVLSLTLILCLALVIPAMAGDSTKTPAAAAASAKNLVKGKIASIADDQKTFEVLTSNGSVVVISVDSETRYYKIDSTAPVIARIKEKAQEQTKTKQENASKNKDNKTAVSDQRGKKDSESVANNKLKGPTAKLQDEDDDIDYEEDPAVEKLLDAETQDVNNIWGRLKSFFNRSPKAGQKGEFSDLAIGDGVVVKVMPNENLAKQVLIIKAPNIINVKGEITEVTATTFTITPKNNGTEPVTLKFDENSRIYIKGAIALTPGQYAVATYRTANLIVRLVEAFPSDPAVKPVVTTNTNAQ